jgi:ribose transport system permease protein
VPERREDAGVALGTENKKRSSPKIAAGRSAPASTVILCATALLFVVSWAVEPQSLSHSSLTGMLPFAAVLAIVAIGQTLVIQQGGIDLSVPGMISLSVVIMTHVPAGDGGKLPEALLLAYACAAVAGLLSGVIVARVGITPIVTTLGMNALLYGVNIQVSHGSTTATTDALQSFATSSVLGAQTVVLIAIAVTAIVGVYIKRTVWGRRFEAVGASWRAARAAGINDRRYETSAYVGASLLYCTAGVLLAGIVHSPSVFQGETYLLPSVAAVVLGGTSLLGGRGSVVASAVGALFISQLDQFVLTNGANTAFQYLVQAGALALGVAFYNVPWRRLERVGARRITRSGGLEDKAAPT